jgi:hypothetical protein
LDLLPLINSKAVRLLDHERMSMQLVSLERSTKAGGQDRIDPNAVAGALVFAYSGSTYSQAQSFKDDAKMAQVYEKWAKAVASAGRRYLQRENKEPRPA